MVQLQNVVDFEADMGRARYGTELEAYAQEANAAFSRGGAEVARREGASRANMIRVGSLLGGSAYASQAALLGSQAGQYRFAGKVGAGTSLLSGAANAAVSYYQPRTTSKG